MKLCGITEIPNRERVRPAFGHCRVNAGRLSQRSLLQWSPATMCRIENSKRHISVEEMATILAAYKVPVAQWNALVAHAKAANEPGWWAVPQR